MEIEEWWPRLDPATQAWLIANNGDVVPAEVIDEITAAGADPAQVGETGPDGTYLSDATTDWIETVANDESPD